MRKQFVALLGSLLLSACWSGPNFYADVPSARPIPEGKYKAVRVFALFPDDEARLIEETSGSRLTLSYDDRGDVIVRDNGSSDESASTRLIPLAPDRGLYIVQVNLGQRAVNLDASLYGLVALTADGYRLSVPPCNGAQRLTPGARVVVNGLLTPRRCSFTDKRAFEDAMLAFADDPTSWTQYRRLKK